jgi:hypothetical protein
MNYYDYRNNPMSDNSAEHTHEFLGSTYIAETGREAHNHRFSGVSSKSISVPGGHVHEIISNTSFDDMHIHQLRIQTGVQIPAGDGKHIHFAKGMTTNEEGHTHHFKFTTLI